MRLLGYTIRRLDPGVVAARVGPLFSLFRMFGKTKKEIESWTFGRCTIGSW